MPHNLAEGRTTKPASLFSTTADGNGVINAEDRMVIGSPHPDFTYWGQHPAGLQELGPDAFAAGVQGSKIFNYVRYWTDFPTFGWQPQP